MDEIGAVLVLVLFCLAIGIFYGMGRWAYKVAISKGRRPVGWVILTLVCTWLTLWPGLIVMLILYLMPNAGESYNLPVTLQTSEATKPCPRCAEKVKTAAKVCRFCNYEFQDVV